MTDGSIVDLVADLPQDIQSRISFALRAGQLAGVAEPVMRRAAYTAAAEVLTSRATELDIAAQYADIMTYVRRDQAEAERLHALAKRLRAALEGGV